MKKFFINEIDKHMLPKSDDESKNNIEGFLCPLCMKKFVSPESLQSHFSLAHSQDSSTTSSTRNDIKKFYDESDMQELRIQLQVKTQLLMDLESKYLEVEKNLENRDNMVRLQNSQMSLIDDVKLKINEDHQYRESQIKTLESKLEAYQKDLESKNNEIVNIKISEQEVVLQLNNSKKENLLLLEQMDNLSKQSIQQVNIFSKLNQELEEYKTQISEQKLQIKETTNSISDLENKLVEVEKENFALVRSLEQEKELVNELKQHLQSESASSPNPDVDNNLIHISELDESKKKCDKLNQSYLKTLNELDENKKKLTELHSSLENFNLKNVELEKELSSSKNKMVEQTEIISKLENNYQQLHKKIETQKIENQSIITNLQFDKDNIQNLYSVLQNENKTNCEIIEKLKLDFDELMKEKNNLEIEKKDLTTETKLSTEKFLSVQIQNQQIETNFKEIETKLKQKEEEFVCLELNMDKILNEKLNSEESNKRSMVEKDKLIFDSQQKILELQKNESVLNAEIKNYKEENEILSNEKLDLDNKLFALNKNFEETSQLNETLRTDLSQKVEELNSLRLIISEKEEHLLQISFSFEALKEEHKKLEKELNFGKEKFEHEIDSLNLVIENKNEELQNKNNKFDETEKQNILLLGHKLELEAKYDVVSNEHKGLLERVVTEEIKLDEEKKKFAQLKQKFDDTKAALQELGRENQTLQIYANKAQSRRWTNDEQVTDCFSCAKLFSVTVRKHHCRNCGNIFCNECSSKSTSLTAAKNPVRVCEQCFIEISKR